jgi:ribonuclease HII
MPDFLLETSAFESGRTPVAGVDEAGRGPLAGPVVAAAVILDPNRIPPGLDDSKKLTAPRREALLDALQAKAEIGVGICSVAEIDSLNILEASMEAMRRALAELTRAPAWVLVDGNRLPAGLPCGAEAVVKGDARSLSIAAASIVAKVTRDRIMTDLAREYPGYGWDRNAGYGTKAHLEAMKSLGVTPHHRVSYRPVHNILYQD